MSRFSLATLAVLSMTVLSAAAGASTINVDFQPGGPSSNPAPGSPNSGYTTTYTSSQGAISAPNATWNAVAPASDAHEVGGPPTVGSFGNWTSDFTSGSLADSTGALTGVTVTIPKLQNNGATGGGFAANTNDGLYGNIATDALQLMSDQLIALNYGGNAANPASATVTINNLANGLYNLVAYGAGDQAVRATLFTVNGVSLGTTGVPGNTPGGAQVVSHTLTAGEDYVTFSNVLVTNGTLAITYRNNSANSANQIYNDYNEGPFNGFQLSTVPPAVPEPASLGLLTVAAPLALLRRRSR